MKCYDLTIAWCLSSIFIVSINRMQTPLNCNIERWHLWETRFRLGPLGRVPKIKLKWIYKNSLTQRHGYLCSQSLVIWWLYTVLGPCHQEGHHRITPISLTLPEPWATLIPVYKERIKERENISILLQLFGYNNVHRILWNGAIVPCNWHFSVLFK